MVGPQKFVKTEKVAPVSRRKEIGLPDTMITTRGSLSEMAVVRPREPGPRQSSMARPRRSVEGRSGIDVPMLSGTWGQSMPQCPS